MTESGNQQARPEPPLDGDEPQTLIGFLEYQRATFAWKTSGLDAQQLDQTVGTSTMTFGGMIKHLAYVEDDWFGRCLFDEPRREPWASVDWSADSDRDWHSAKDDTTDALRTLWNSSVERARAYTGRALASGGPGRRAERSWPDGRSPSLRWILTHMIEEYARHNGHADLIRESIDGSVGD